MASGPNVLEVTVHEARGIIGHDRGGVSDAIVHVQVAGGKAHVDADLPRDDTRACAPARADTVSRMMRRAQGLELPALRIPLHGRGRACGHRIGRQ